MKTGLIDEILQIIRSASSNNIKELRIRQLVGKDNYGGHWVVDVFAPLETVIDICRRLHISPSKFRRRYKRRPVGIGGKSEIGPTGRLIHIRSDPQLDEFLQGTSRLGPITPEQIVGVTIEIASHRAKLLKAPVTSKLLSKLSQALPVIKKKSQIET